MHCNTRRRKNNIDISKRNKTKMQDANKKTTEQSSTSIINQATNIENKVGINDLKTEIIKKNTNKNNTEPKVNIKEDDSKIDFFYSAGIITCNQETDQELIQNTDTKSGVLALERKPLRYFKCKDSQNVNLKSEGYVQVRQRRVKVKNKAVSAVESSATSTCNVSTAMKGRPVKDLPIISDDSESGDEAGVGGGARLSDSTHSTEAMCRICHGGELLSAELGELISACSCRGSVGRVHVKCLERWLTESCKSRCELCGTRYFTRRVHKYGVPKALIKWILSQNSNQLMVDSLGIVLMSPLAVLAAWLSGRTLAGLMMQESQVTPWPLASTFVLACMTLVCYYCWIVSAATRHALAWWLWYRSQYEVRLQLDLDLDLAR